MKRDPRKFLTHLCIVFSVCAAFSCKDSEEQVATRGNVHERGFTPQDWAGALQAFALDSADHVLLQTWNAKRNVQQDSLAPWLRRNHWPVQSLGLRLAEQALLQFGSSSEQEAQTKLDTVAAIARDLKLACNDSLLVHYLSTFVSQLNPITKAKRARLTLQRLEARWAVVTRSFEDARRSYEALRDTARALGDSLLEIHAEQGMLDVHAQLDQYAQVVAHGRDLLALTQRRGYAWAEAQTLNLVADAYRGLDRDSLALHHTQMAFEIAQRMNDRLTLRDCYFYRARILYRMDRLTLAERALEEMQRLDIEQAYRADALLLRGQLHSEQGEYGPAQSDFEESGELFARDGDVANVAAVRSNLSLLHLETGDYEHALAEERQAYELHKQEKNKNRMARSQLNLGVIFMKMDSLARAQTSNENALQLFPTNGGARGRVETMLLQGELLIQHGLLAQAEQTFRAATQTADSIGFMLGLASARLYSAKVALQQNQTAVCDSLLNVAEETALALNNPVLKTEAQWQRARLERQRGRPRIALTHLERAIALQEGVFATIRRDSLRVSFFATAQEIFDEAVTVALELDENEHAFMLSERGRARALWQAWGRELADSVFAAEGAGFSLNAVQRALPRNAQIVAYRVLPKALVVWRISPQDFMTAQVAITRSALADSVQNFLRSLGAIEVQAFRQRVIAEREAVYRENRAWGRKLYQWILGPVAAQLPSGSELYLIPDGVLHELPFGALVDVRDRFVEEDFIIAKAPSVAVLQQGLRAHMRVPKLSANRLLYVGDPGGDLPAAREEARVVAAHFPQRTMLTQQHARFDTIAASLRAGAEVFHLALHAVADPQRALNSYVELSRAEATAMRPHTERVYARQLLEWQMPDTWLVLLNGCETARGKIVRGEGVLNIARLFALQRVALVVSSLWQNDDRRSVALLAAFYRQLEAGAAPQAALHYAKLEMMRKLSEDGAVQSPLPYFWAVFDLYLNRAVSSKT